MPAWARSAPTAEKITISVHVQPGASTTGPAGRHGTALKLRISARAADNKANEALLDYLKDALRVPRTAVRIVHGAHSRAKVVEIDAHPETVAAQLRAWDAGHLR